MFGAEKKKPEKFQFDLEKELKSNRSKAKELLALSEHSMNEIKTHLRNGDAHAGAEMGELLHGFGALHKVISRIEKQ